ncbi:HTH domain-containing protein [Halorientalis salina]|uniref:HTH domain-containing protein n=1 Tax=Halorientalis salina TaxID=2932266 RepID=UPI0010AC02DA|nr:HTH domain-containing protein [Halorientalis salina]
METTTDTDPVRLEFYVRTLSPPGARARQEAVLERLQRLAADGHIDDLYVKVWGKQIDPTTRAAETDQGQFILNRIAEFKQWALAENTTLESFYQTHEQSSSITGEEHTSIVLPKMGLAEYHGSELEQVAPCTTGEETYSIVDHIDDLERRLAGPSATEQETVSPVAEE